MSWARLLKRVFDIDIEHCPRCQLGTIDPNAEVRVTWESVINAIDSDNIYCSADGVVLIDGDGNFYKEQFQKENIKDGWPPE